MTSYLLALVLFLSPSADEFVTSCLLGRFALVREALSAGLAPSVTDQSGETPLVAASSQRQLEIVKYLLRHGADPNQFGRSGRSALEEAAWDGETEIMRILLDAGADPNLGNMAPVYTAVLSHNPKAVELLIKRGASARSKGRENPLLRACQTGFHQAVPLLLSAGARPELTDGVNPPLHEAAARGHVRCVEHLLRWGVNPLRKNQDGQLPFQLAAAAGHEEVALLLLPGITDKGIALEAAAAGNLLEICRLLCGEKTEVTSRALLATDQKSVLKLLLEQGGDLKSAGAQLLLKACKTGNTEIVEYLLSQGLKPRVRDDNDATPLMWAAASAEPRLVALLLEHGANPKARDARGRGPMDHFRLRVEAMKSALQRLQRYRCIKPEEKSIRANLRRYQEAEVLLLELLSTSVSSESKKAHWSA